MKRPDICLILEGTYPFVHGGVSAWTHELICRQKDFTFYLMCLMAPDFEGEPCFEIPDNVVGMSIIHLQKLPHPLKLIEKSSARLFHLIHKPLMAFCEEVGLKDFRQLVNAFSRYRKHVDHRMMINSPHAWKLLTAMYNKSMPELSFIDFFWAWRTLIGGLFSVMIAELPDAGCYHALCTGYAGLMMARAHIEKKARCIVTEHGIYTNERKFEIAFADWITDQKSFSLSVSKTESNRELRDFWTNIFMQYSRLCYECAEHIITLFSGNQRIQINEHADPAKCQIIPNGIDLQRYSSIARDPDHPPTIALIGRVVPIKDVKTFIRATGLLHERLPEVKSYILGETSEDREYYAECVEMVANDNLSDVITFTGKVNINDYLPRIDVIALSSISEAQPLTILETAAAGIPSVVTDVGACREMIEGMESESPGLGPGGIVTGLASPRAMCNALHKLLTDKEFYDKCCESARARAFKYYGSDLQQDSYRNIYRQTLGLEEREPAPSGDE